jgi:hypothetical protein
MEGTAIVDGTEGSTVGVEDKGGLNAVGEFGCIFGSRLVFEHPAATKAIERTETIVATNILFFITLYIT